MFPSRSGVSRLAAPATIVAGLTIPLTLLLPTRIAAQEPGVVFMEPAGVISDSAGEGLPLFVVVTDTARLAAYTTWLVNDAAHWALGLYRTALDAARDEGAVGFQPQELHIALVPGGNNAAAGFRLATPTDTVNLPGAAYIELAPQEWRFGITLLHEAGHVALRVLAGRALPRRSIASISHTTAALTDRTTAFDEGFAISFETLIAQLSEEWQLRNKYRHGQLLFGVWPGLLAEYYRQSADLTTFSQTVARYAAVRDNAFAFATAQTSPDYLRVQLESARNFGELRDANQLLQSEGFYASFFFSLLARGKALPTPAEVAARQAGIVRALGRVVRDESLDADTPYLLRFLSTYHEVRPEEYGEALDVLLDLSHGVFVDPGARDLWRRHYLGALRLDMEAVDREGIEARRAEWRRAALADPDTLPSLLGPQVPCAVPSVTVELPGLGVSNPLSFDINTAQAGILRMIPGITDGDVARWLEARASHPFADREDLAHRAGLSPATLVAMTCPTSP